MQDYGSIVLIDERYTWHSNRSQISKWLRDRIRIYSSPEELSESFQTFFTEMKSRNFVPKVEQLAQVHLEIDPPEDAKADKKGRRTSKLNGRLHTSNGSEDESKSQEDPHEDPPEYLN